MSSKDSFSHSEWDHLIRLPYRIGLWMSDLEEGGGKRAQEAEMKALSEIVLTINRKYENVPLIHALTEDLKAFAQKSETISIASLSEESIMDDCRRVIESLEANAERKEVNIYKILLMDVAEAIAKAAPDRDFGAYNLYGGPEGVMGMFAMPMRLGWGPKVSLKEKKAINRLIENLDAEDVVQKWDLDPYPKRKDQ